MYKWSWEMQNEEKVGGWRLVCLTRQQTKTGQAHKPQTFGSFNYTSQGYDLET